MMYIDFLFWGAWFLIGLQSALVNHQLSVEVIVNCAIIGIRFGFLTRLVYLLIGLPFYIVVTVLKKKDREE